jgi:hypothetical protein
MKACQWLRVEREKIEPLQFVAMSANGRTFSSGKLEWNDGSATWKEGHETAALSVQITKENKMLVE